LRLSREFAVFSLFVTGIIVAIGTFWAFQRGGHDFDVFYATWRFVIEGRALELYSDATPDRFLYAPGFAWVFSVIGLLPRDLALAVWCLGKAAVIGYVIREFGLRLSANSFLPRDRVVMLGFAAWGVLLFSRPVLIDFQYGQVNVFILGACVWALFGRFDKNVRPWLTGARWFVLALLAVTKLFPGPLLLVPFLATTGFSRKQIWIERAGVFLGACLILVIPAVSLGFSGAIELLWNWKDMLLQKGLPLETHNQSFTAFLMHYFSGEAAPVIAQGGSRIEFGTALLSMGAIRAMSLIWMVSALGALLVLIRRGKVMPPLTWVGVLVGAIILPSHLIWKPYFVFAIPVAILGAHRLVGAVGRYKNPSAWAALALLFAAVNLSGFDFVGHHWGARFEAAALLFWAELVLIAIVLWPRKPLLMHATPRL